MNACLRDIRLPAEATVKHAIDREHKDADVRSCRSQGPGAIEVPDIEVKR
jgi:hypothetical protein